MGTWGVAVFSDDLAADLRDEFRDLIGEGLSSTEAVDKLLGEYASSLEDDNEKSVFWIALAAAQWKLGRLEERTKKEALSLIATGEDLKALGRPEGSQEKSGHSGEGARTAAFAATARQARGTHNQRSQRLDSRRSGGTATQIGELDSSSRHRPSRGQGGPPCCLRTLGLGR